MLTEDITSIIIDAGSQNIRAGYSGEDTPRVVMPSLVGQTESKIAEEGANNYYAGDINLRLNRGDMKISETINKGIITDFDGYTELIQSVYKDQMQINPRDYSLIMSENSIHNIRQREKLCEIIFETIEVPNYYTVKSAPLSCFSSGKSSALILDSGYQITQSIPVYDGYAMQKQILEYEIGGHNITELIGQYAGQQSKILPHHLLNIQTDEKDQRKVIENDASMYTSSFNEYHRYQIIQDMKHWLCKVEEKSIGEQTDPSTYELPDGTQITINKEKYTACEIFFEENENSKFKGFHHQVLESINSSDIDIRKELFSNVIITGGNTMLSGLMIRLQSKLNDISPPNSKLKLISYPNNSDRKFSSWIGGSILASLGSFQSMWIGKFEYQECGTSIMEKKCA